MKPRARNLFGGGFASPEQRLDQAAIVESYDVRQPLVRRPRRESITRTRPRRSRPPGVSIAQRKITRAMLESQAYLLQSELASHATEARPAKRGDCSDGPRPCPWVSCRHHLYLDVNPDSGSIKINFVDREPWELADSCALDVADRGGVTLEKVGEVMNVTRERIRQIEVRTMIALKLSGRLSP